MKKWNLDKFELYDQKLRSKTTHINLFTISDCNSECWYCVEKDNLVRRKQISTKTFNNVLKFIDAQEREYVYFNFYGGEPTLHRQLKSFIRKLHNKYQHRVSIVVNTNLMRTLSYYKSFPEYTQFLCSLHNHCVERSDQWMWKALSLHKRGQLNHVYIMLENVYDMKEMLQLYRKYEGQLLMQLSPIDQIKGSDEYEEFKDEYSFKEHNSFDHFDPEDVVVVSKGVTYYKRMPNWRLFGNFKGMLCNAGFDILENGDVKWCAADTEILLNVNDDYIGGKQIKTTNHLCKFEDCPSDPWFAKYSVKHAISIAKEIKT